MQKHPSIFFRIKYTEAILSNSTRKLLWFEISKMLIAFFKEDKFIVSFITVFGTLSFPISILSRFCFRSWYSTLNGLDLNLETRRYVPVSGHELKFWGRPHRPHAVRIDAAFSCTSHAAWSVREARGWAIQNGWTDRNVDCCSDLFGREDLVLERRTYLLRGKGKVHVSVHFQSGPRLCMRWRCGPSSNYHGHLF